MKKSALIVSVLALLAPAVASAGFVGHSDQTISTVAEIQKMKDDRPVIMKGTIEKHLRKDKYQFTDGTGTITVEIDNDKWRGIEVTPKNTVLIYGETDTGWLRNVEVEADAVKLAD